MKVRATRFINFGIIEDKMLVFQKDELVDFPEGEVYKPILEQALEDGFLVKFEEKKTLFTKVISSKPKTEKKETPKKGD